MTERVHDFLTKPRRLREKVTQKEIALRELRASMGPKAIVYDKDKVQSSPGDPMIQFAERLDELNTERTQLFEEYKTALLAVSHELDVLGESDAVGATVLQLRYVGQKSWRVIADEMTLIRQQDDEGIYDSERWVYRKADIAYDELEKILSDVSPCQ